MQKKNKEKEQHLMLWDEQICRFLRGQMSADEADTFRAELKKNEALRQRAVLQARLIKQMQEVGEEREQRIADAMRAVSPEEARLIAQGKGKRLISKPKKSLTRRLAPWIGIAAVVCCVLMVGRYYLGPHPVRTLERYAYALRHNSTGRHHRPTVEPVQVCQLDSVALRRQQLEELALLRGKIEMGLDIEASTRKLQAIFDAACADSISPYKPFLYDMAFTLMEGYDKTGNDTASRDVLDAIEKWDDGLLMSDK